MSLNINNILANIDLRAPRYTSYPAAPHFTELTQKTHASWLGQIPQSEAISLYIHLPFCDRLCWFCGCFTKITSTYRPIAKMVGNLVTEIKMVAQLLGERRKVVHLHFGGGSPSVMLPDDFSAIMDTIHQYFHIDENAEIAVELDPRTVSDDKIETYAAQGVNRASLGIQDFDPAVQKAINRIQPFSMIRDVLDSLNSVGIDKINMDLIYGLPLQTPESLHQTAESTILLNPTRISLFAYAHVPWLKRHQKMINQGDLPDLADRLKMNKMMSRRFEEAGYEAIGIDHFARPDDRLSLAQHHGGLRRNFQGYTDDNGQVLLGFGPSAISKLPQGYAQNTSSFQEYRQAIMASHLPSARGHELSENDLVFGAVIEQLMCYFRVDLAVIAEGFGLPVTHFSAALAALQSLPGRELFQISGNIIEVKKDYRMYVRMIAAQFDQYRDIGNAKYSKIA
jgi:oxygen-independent coproporphyrinogen III oxidase